MVIEKSETVQCSKTYALVHKQINADCIWPETHVHTTSTQRLYPQKGYLLLTCNSVVLINVSLNDHIQYIRWIYLNIGFK